LILNLRKFHILTNQRSANTVNIKEQEDNHEDPKIPTATKNARKMRELRKRKMKVENVS